MPKAFLILSHFSLILHTESMNASHVINLLTNSCDLISTIGKAPPHPRESQRQPTIPLFVLTKG